MYTPPAFAIDDAQEIERFLTANVFGQIISLHEDKLTASALPFLYDAENQRLLAHLARANPQLESLDGQDVLVTFLGEHGYISPSWYEDQGVPTWNYQSVHVSGRCNVISDTGQLTQLLDTMTHSREADFEQPWPISYPETLLNAIVGIEISIARLECKYKLSQNKGDADRAKVVARLEQIGMPGLANEMRRIKPF